MPAYAIYDLKTSPYIYQYEDLELFFSTEFKLTNFKDKINDYLITENVKLNRYDAIIDLNKMFIISLYKQIEKKGFYVLYRGQELKSNYKILTEIEV